MTRPTTRQIKNDDATDAEERRASYSIDSSKGGGKICRVYTTTVTLVEVTSIALVGGRMIKGRKVSRLPKAVLPNVIAEPHNTIPYVIYDKKRR